MVVTSSNLNRQISTNFQNSFTVEREGNFQQNSYLIRPKISIPTQDHAVIPILSLIEPLTSSTGDARSLTLCFVVYTRAHGTGGEKETSLCST